MVLFRSKKFLDFDTTIAFLFVFSNYCSTIDYRLKKFVLKIKSKLYN
jgi:hypothetical protein